MKNKKQTPCWVKECPYYATPRRLWCRGCGASFYRWHRMSASAKADSTARANRRIGRIESFPGFGQMHQSNLRHFKKRRAA